MEREAICQAILAGKRGKGAVSEEKGFAAFQEGSGESAAVLFCARSSPDGSEENHHARRHEEIRRGEKGKTDIKR